MKRFFIFALIACLLFSIVGCAAENNDSSNISYEDSADESQNEYEDKAHQALKDYFPSVDESEDDLSLEESINSESGEESDLSIESDETTLDDVVSETESDTEVSDETSGEDESEISQEPIEDRGTVFLVTADIAYADGYGATLVCTSDGGVDLYFDNGTELTEMGLKADCKANGLKLVEACQKYINEGEETTEFPFPTEGNTFVYIKTEKGVFCFKYDNTQIFLGAVGDIEICIKNTVTVITQYAEQ